MQFIIEPFFRWDGYLPIESIFDEDNGLRDSYSTSTSKSKSLRAGVTDSRCMHQMRRTVFSTMSEGQSRC